VSAAEESKENSFQRGVLEVKKKIGDEVVTFELHDDVSRFRDNQWKRVVGVFVNGNEWQFKDWPHDKKLLELFLRVRGFFLHYQDQILPDMCKKWNIKILNLQRNKRHQDISVQNEFWNDLESFLKKEKFNKLSF